MKAYQKLGACALTALFMLLPYARFAENRMQMFLPTKKGASECSEASFFIEIGL